MSKGADRFIAPSCVEHVDALVDAADGKVEEARIVVSHSITAADWVHFSGAHWNTS
jgi:hypothetical protein